MIAIPCVWRYEAGKYPWGFLDMGVKDSASLLTTLVRMNQPRFFMLIKKSYKTI